MHTNEVDVPYELYNWALSHCAAPNTNRADGPCRQRVPPFLAQLLPVRENATAESDVLATVIGSPRRADLERFWKDGDGT